MAGTAPPTGPGGQGRQVVLEDPMKDDRGHRPIPIPGAELANEEFPATDLDFGE